MTHPTLLDPAFCVDHLKDGSTVEGHGHTPNSTAQRHPTESPIMSEHVATTASPAAVALHERLLEEALAALVERERRHLVDEASRPRA